MDKKNLKKRSTKTDPNLQEKLYLSNIIRHLDKYAKDSLNDDIRAYFQRKADLNRQKLKDIE